jgi:quercetin dioxygenase-like cupin family protein
MRINANFSQRATEAPSPGRWVNSPESGVDRFMLDRIGDEVARATSIVRYAAGSSFARHTHAEGEEFLVLEGVFSDEHGDYPRGTYVRNPPGTGHSPFSVDGCRILVKLRQFDAGDLEPVVADAIGDGNWRRDERTGGEYRELHQFGTEQVAMLRMARSQSLEIEVGEGGLEWLLVSGSLQFENLNYAAESWFRFPAGDSFRMKAIEDCTIFQKRGHLPAN